MKKAVILGCENSHANKFLDLIATGNYPEIEIIGVYSDDTAAAEKLNEKYGVKVMKTYDEAVGQADGVIVTARHGGKHYPFAAPYMATAKAMFIDKPITIDQDEALTLVRQMQEHGIGYTGGSCNKYMDYIQKLRRDHETQENGRTLGGLVRAPISLTNEHGGFYFYAQHLVEMVCEVYGYHPKSVLAIPNGPMLTVLFRYDGFDVTGLYIDNNWKYFVARMAEKGSEGSEVSGANCFEPEFNEFYRLLLGGEQGVTADVFVAPVFIMNAIDRSISSGKEEAVEVYEV